MFAWIIIDPSFISNANNNAVDIEKEEFVEELDIKIGELKIKDYLFEVEKRIFIERVVQVATITATSAALAALAAILLYLILFGVVIFEKRDNQIIFLALSILKQREILEINLPKVIACKSESNDYCISLNSYIANKYQLEPIVIRHNNEEYITVVENIIEIYLE